jgi:hypothetical protein
MQYGDLINCGFVLDDLNPFLIKRIQSVTAQFKDNFKNNQRIESYDLDSALSADLKSDIEKEARRLIVAHEIKYRYFNKMYNSMTSIPAEQVGLELERIWITIQRKGEFLPIHNHSGVYSFVIWVDIPFNMEDEIKSSPNPTTEKNRAGLFQFVYADTLGKVSWLTLPVDKKWQGRICVFPAELNHQVYPFYSSDDVRVSIAGNFRIHVKL